MAHVRESMDSWKKWLNEKLDEKNAFTDKLKQFENKTGVQKIYLIYGVIALIAIWLMVGYGAQMLCNFIGFLYPAYASVKAIESANKDDDTQWLIYWVVYSVFALVELFTDIFFSWVPFYWFFKCCFLIWCMVPQSWNGSDFVYKKVVKPFVLKYQGEIERGLSKAKDVGAQLVDEGNKLGTKLATDAVKEALNKED